MEIRKWTTVDVHYKKSEQKEAERERKRLEGMGYEYQQTDLSGHPKHDYCDQYIKFSIKLPPDADVAKPLLGVRYAREKK